MDYSLYAITPIGLEEQELLYKIEQAVLGGITVLQYREKKLQPLDMVERVQKIQEILYPKSIPLIINDYIDVAKVTNADGVHLGQEDIEPQKAREYLGDGFVIGLSVGSEEELDRLDISVVDYVGCGAIFPTKTKHDVGKAIGLEKFSNLRKKIIIPFVGIGGINIKNVEDVLKSGADGVAVVLSLIHI